MPDSMIELKLYERARNNRYLYTAWGRDITDKFKADITNRIKSQKNIAIEIWGEQGNGKSYSGLSIASGWIGVDWDVYYLKDNVIKDLSIKTPPYTVLLDEQNESGNFGLGSWRVASEYSGFMETMRKRQISFINCCPVSKILPLCNYGIEAFYINEDKQECNCIVYDRNGLMLGKIIVPHPLTYMSRTELDRYESMKDKYNDLLLHKNSEDRYSEMGDKFIQSDYWIKIKNQWVAKNPKKEIPIWLIEQSLNVFYPELKRNIEIIELVNVVRFKLYSKGDVVNEI